MPDLSFSINPGNSDLVYSNANGQPRVLKSLDAAAQALTGLAATPVTGSTATRQLLLITAAITPASVLNATAPEQTIAFAGLLTTDTLIALLPPAAPTANVMQGPVRIPSNGNIAIQYVNPTAGSLTPAAGTYTAVVLR
jgi:hypothetical protein